MKVAVYAIAKNEQANVLEWLNQFKEADYIVVVDTGSTDNTLMMLEANKTDFPQLTYFNIAFTPFRFDSAKNIALSFVPKDADICFTCDFDERVSDNVIDTLRNTELNYNQTGSINLIFSRDGNGAPAITYPRESVHLCDGFYWKYPVHEILSKRDGTAHETISVDIDVNHLPDTSKDRRFYLELLELMLEENNDVPRAYQYLGREHMYNGNYFDAVQYLKRHIEIEPHGPFRSESAIYIGQCYLGMVDGLEDAETEAESWFLRAAAEFNRSREPYIHLAHLYMKCGEMEAAIGMARIANGIEKPTAVAVINEMLYDSMYVYHLLATCYYNMGRVDDAKQAITDALSGRGDTVQVPADMLRDIALIFGVENVSKHSQPEHDSESRPQEVRGDGRTGEEVLPEAVSEKLSQEVDERAEEGSDSQD